MAMLGINWARVEKSWAEQLDCTPWRGMVKCESDDEHIRIQNAFEFCKLPFAHHIFAVLLCISALNVWT